MGSETLLEISDVTCYLDKGVNIFSNISFSANKGDILVLQGRSGSGKSTLLKCIAQLNMHTGDTLYRGRTPREYGAVHFAGIPAFRTRVMYVPQRPSLLPGSPYDFLVKVTSFRAHKTLSKDSGQDSIKEVFERAIEIGEQWGIQDDLWRRNWINLSGGEGQRILIAAAVSLNTAEILLLDEPTSALDAETSLLVENYLVERIKASDTTLKSLIWITHSPEQSQRVGTRFIYLSGGGYYESDDPNPSPYPNTPIG